MRSEIKRLLIVLLISFLLGWLLDSMLLVLLIALGIYIGFHFAQQYRLYRWLYCSKKLEPPEAGGIWGEIFDGIFHLQRRSSSRSQRLKAAIDHIRESFSALKDAAVMLDSRGNLEWWNEAAETYLGFRAPDDRGQVITNLFRHPRFIEYFEKKDYDEPLQLCSPVDERVQLQIQITLFGREDRLLLARNVTRLHHLEIMRKDFVANVSHELRTPLTVVRGYLETMLDHANEFYPQWKKSLQEMNQQTDRMDNLVRDLLLLSRLETVGHENIEEINVQLLIYRIYQDACAYCEQHEISFDLILKCDESLWIKGNKNELYSAFTNLVINAINYSSAGGTIIISWQPVQQGAVFSVKDQGQGIDPEHIPRLTERFYRVDKSHSSKTGGTGLGLAIVKHVLMRHDGELCIRSEPGQGSTFKCLFPGENIVIKTV